jgi:hypothetical protein
MLVRPMRVVCIFAFAAAVLILTACATGRYDWSLAHAYMSPRARQLPRAELEEIVWLVSHAWGDAIIAVGGACNEGRDQMHVVAKYTDYEVMISTSRRRPDIGTSLTPVKALRPLAQFGTVADRL